MSLKIEEIRNSNKQYYYANYFYKVGHLRSTWFITSILALVILQFFTYLTVREFEKQYYIKNSQLVQLDSNQEVMDYVSEQMGNYSAIPFFTILAATIFILAISFVLNIQKLSFNLYKRKGTFIFITLVAFLAEFIIVFIFESILFNDNSRLKYFMLILYLLKFVFLIPNSGIALPIEMKTPVKWPYKLLSKIIDRVLNKIIDNALKKL